MASSHPSPVHGADALRHLHRSLLRQWGGWSYRLREPLLRVGRPLRALLAQRNLMASAVRAPETRTGSSIHLTGSFLAAMARYDLTVAECFTFRLHESDPHRRARHFVNTHLLVTLLHQVCLRGDARTRQDYADLRDKRRFAARCQAHGLASVEIWGAAEGNQAAMSAPSAPTGDLFLKPAGLFGGHHAQRLTFDPMTSTWRTRQGARISASDLPAFLVQQAAEGAIILQPWQRNHPDLQALTPGALATIRIVTCIQPDGSAAVVLPTLRMPVGEGDVDNASQGGLAVALDPSTGRLDSDAIQPLAAGASPRHLRHPATGAVFAGRQVPYWEEARDLVLRAQGEFRGWPAVGWDVAITESGPCLLEGNVRWGGNVIQGPSQRPLGTTEFPAAFLHFWNQQSLHSERDLPGRRSTPPPLQD